MKLTTVILIGLVTSACASDYATRPTPPSPQQLFPSVWVMAFKGYELECLPATIQVVAGQRAGHSLVQEAGYCDPWDSFGSGVIFRDLEDGVAMTIRASAPGHEPQEQTVIPSLARPSGITTFHLLEAR